MPRPDCNNPLSTQLYEGFPLNFWLNADLYSKQPSSRQRPDTINHTAPSWQDQTRTKPFAMSSSSPQSLTAGLGRPNRKHHCILHGHLWIRLDLAHLPKDCQLLPGPITCRVCTDKLGEILWKCRVHVCGWEVCRYCKEDLDRKQCALALATWTT